MFGVPDYGAFVVAILVFLAIPGPGNLALLTATAQGGVRAGLAATLGVIAGDQVLLWLAVAGVAAVLVTHPAWFVAVQWMGALYLGWLGWRLWRTRAGDGPVLRLRPHHYFRQAWLITLLNPKAIVFYMAFFPLFVDPQQHQGLPTFVFMAVTIAALSLLYGCVVVTLAHVFAQRVRSHAAAGVWLNRLAGSLLMGFGLKLALSK